MRWRSIMLVVAVTPLLGGCFGIPGLGIPGVPGIPGLQYVGYARTAAKLALGRERYEEIDPIARTRRQVREAILRPQPQTAQPQGVQTASTVPPTPP